MEGAVYAVILLNMARLTMSRDMLPFVIDGNFSNIKNFPYVASLTVLCHETNRTTYFICGGSILNQLLILTAAHCVDICEQYPQDSLVRVGNENREKGFVIPIVTIAQHPDYSARPMMHDIALATLDHALTFGNTVKKVVLMKDPPYYDESAVIAGWGLIDLDRNTGTDLLKHTNQKVLSREDCLKTLSRWREGFLCTGANPGYIAKGDSGSPLVVRNYIQIGLVSFKKPTINQKVAFYTDVGYYYDWIETTFTNLCEFENKTKENHDGESGSF